MSTATPGWYDDGSGRQRWWDGTSWTDHFAETADPAAVVSSPKPNAIVTRAQQLRERVTSSYDHRDDPDAVWTAVGRSLTGLGSGRYKLTTDYLIFESGTFSSKGQQIRTREIFDVDSSQSMSQKARGVGSITLLARRPSGDERVVLQDIPNFREGVDAINRVSDEARIATQLREKHLRETVSRSHIEYAGVAPVVASSFGPMGAAPATSTPGADLNSELERLAQLKERGILDDEEFVAAKRKLLGL